MESDEHPFAELPAALVDEMLRRTETLSQKLLKEFEEVRSNHRTWRDQLARSGLLRRDSELPYVPIPTVCGVDGSYAVERLLASDLVAAAGLAVEGLTPPSEGRYWPEPRHLVWIETETHEADTGTILRALMIGMELQLASEAPHEVVLLDGSLTTPMIYFNQAMNRAQDALHLRTTQRLLDQMESYLEAYATIVASNRTDRCWVAAPKYTTNRELGLALGWPSSRDDRSVLSLLLEPGEFTAPRSLQRPAAPWHLSLRALPEEKKARASRSGEHVAGLLSEIQVVYYRPYPWLPALRLEMSRAVTQNAARLASVLHGIRHQCGTPAVMEPYPLYMADRMVKHLRRAIPTFRQVTSQRIAETYEGNIDDVFLGLHSYRTESGV